MTNPDSLGKLINGHHSRVTLATLQSTQILLRETGFRRDLLLRKPAFAPKPRKVSANDLAHVHVDCLPNMHYRRYLL